MKRIFVPNYGPNTDKLIEALAASVREARRIEATTITLVTPLKNLPDTVMGDILGKEASKALVKGQGVLLGDGISLSYHSYATFPSRAQLAVVLAIHLAEEDLAKLDDSFSKCLIYVPWAENEGEKWVAKWGAEIEGSAKEISPIDLEGAIIESLEILTRMVNLSSGLVHPSDKENAKRRFSELRGRGISWDPEEIEKWAVRNKWAVKHAKTLADLSAKYVT